MTRVAHGWILILRLLAALLCVAAIVAIRGEEIDSRVARLEEKTKQIDEHLIATDAIADRMWAAVNAQGAELSKIEGIMEARFGILGALGTGSIFIQIKSRKGS